MQFCRINVSTILILWHRFFSDWTWIIVKTQPLAWHTTRSSFGYRHYNQIRILSLSLFLPIKFPLSLQYFSQYIDTLLPNRSKLLFLTAFIAQEGRVVFFFGGREREYRNQTTDIVRILLKVFWQYEKHYTL